MQTATRQGLMRMKDLSTLTGLSKSAIRFYLSQGLAPGPIQAGKNSALYGEETLKALQSVKHLRQEEQLSLPLVRQAMDQVDGKGKPQGLGELRRALAALGGEKPSLTLDALVQRAGLPASLIKKAERLGLIVPLMMEGEQRYGEADAATATSLRELLEMGVNWKELEDIGRAVRAYLEIQIQIQRKLVTGMDSRGLLRVNSKLLRIGHQTNRYLFDRHLKREVEGQLTALKEASNHEK